ncbi:hypothetical protein [Leptospira stimsonii]|uniref:hypothetical protein n=1 Tax=Leptospira stimsonii TaxID=2202203 RepID=UPI0014385D8A|nr:hypothetical protein [Leptospira stimsonii]
MSDQEKEIAKLKYKVSLIKEVFATLLPKFELYLSSKEKELVKSALNKIGE